MSEKTIVVTGATGGLGVPVVERLLESGARVVGVGLPGESGATHERYTALGADLTDESQVRRAMEQASAGGRMDALVHLAGGWAGGTVAETTTATFEKMIAINLRTAFLAMREATPYLRKNGGRVVAIGSRAVESPAAGMGAYAAAKSALVALIKAYAAENAANGITANVLLPATLDTAANRKSMPTADRAKWVQPATLAETILFLLSDAGAQITGAAIPIYARDI